MSYSRFSVSDFGSGRTGLTNVGYRLWTQASGFDARVAPATEIIDGKYGALITYPDLFRGAEVWDSGEVDPVYAVNVINPETDELLAGADQILLVHLYTPTGQPATIIPVPGNDATLCRVFGYLEDLDNKPARNVRISFMLAQDGPFKSERVLSKRPIAVTTDKTGYFQIDLQRNDQIEPAGSKYRVTSEELGLDNKEITLEADLFDLMSVIP